MNIFKGYIHPVGQVQGGFIVKKILLKNFLKLLKA